MKRKNIRDGTKKIRVPILLMLMAFVFIISATIAYPALSEQLRIVGEATFETICVADISNANAPALASNMIPIKWDGTNWVKANTSNPCDNLWYNYDSQIWANAVTVKESTRANYQLATVGTPILEDDILTYFVWIPRYRYKLFNAGNGVANEQTIEIIFESKNTTKSTGSTNGTYLTHPAFTFGNEELTGFWVGKFEPTGTISTACTNESCTTMNLTIKPNLSSVRSQTVSSMFYASRSMSTASGNQYGFLASEVNTHMMKNSEWGAVAYLSHSIYGINAEITINNSSTSITGCAGNSVSESDYAGCQNSYETVQGQKASTTGNIYGIYDMSGGAYEYVMGNMKNSTGSFYSSSAGFSTAPESKYYDSYTYGTTFMDVAAYARGLLGDATRETLKTFEGGGRGGWYADFTLFPNSTLSWFLRGCNYANGTDTGVFTFTRGQGNISTSDSFRVVLHK